jgi:hypothetical protein
LLASLNTRSMGWEIAHLKYGSGNKKKKGATDPASS